jgi:hypothetical protein
VNINTLLLTIRLLLAHPNAADGLVPDITEEYKRSYARYYHNAKEYTRRHAAHVTVPQCEVDCAVGVASCDKTTVKEEDGDARSVDRGSVYNAGPPVTLSLDSSIYEGNDFILLGCNRGAENSLRRMLAGIGSASVEDVDQPQDLERTSAGSVHAVSSVRKRGSDSAASGSLAKKANL